ncbi:ubiquitin fusion degradation protein [Niveomyces insectorum RCEF 264]|uniref:Ubiquitin fusion degradation protein n=1 Tax=Niveomyces insectorum RCEF 264 TaxID=1081102 RepID=A0A167XW51_9HYPO|nr:ubiquitin fusion degradation protein [Niveomyces insectorum RCEF 264]
MDVDDDDNDDDYEFQSQQQPQLPTVRYTDSFAVAPADRVGSPGRTLQGDKILLPPSALEALLSAAARAGPPRTAAAELELPQPLTFRLVNPTNQRAVYAGIREFSAAEGQVVLSSYLRTALGLDDDDDDDASTKPTVLSVSLHRLPKGTFVRLRPLAAGYRPADWRPLLERQLREGYTTLTQGTVFAVRGSTAGETFRFRVDGFRPPTAADSAESANGRAADTQKTLDGICVVDTDLEVDIEAADDELVAETSVHTTETGTKPTTTTTTTTTPTTSSPGGKIDIWKPVTGQVRAGDYVDYELPSWDRSRPLAIVLTDDDDDSATADRSDPDETYDKGYAVDLLVSPRSTRQRVVPRETEFVWANFSVADDDDDDTAAQGAKTITLAPSDAELAPAESLLITVHGWQPHGNRAATTASSTQPHRYTLRVRTILEEEGAAAGDRTHQAASRAKQQQDHGSGEEQCGNCHQWVPARTMVLHENFCRRNNVVCPECGHVFQRRSAAWRHHWHCAVDPADGGHGNTTASRAKHDAIFHPSVATSPASSSPYSCPACGELLPPFPSLPALARHRTTTCPAKRILCQFCQLEVPQEGDPTDPADAAATALTGQTPHERADGAHQAPRAARGRDAGSLRRALRRRVERRYLSQLLTGCGKAWCANPWCKTGRQNQGMEPLGGGKGGGTAALLPLVKPLVAAACDGNGNDDGNSNENGEAIAAPLHFCVDAASQARRTVAETLAAQGVYALPWCIAACESAGADAQEAWAWLADWAPQKRAAASPT